VQAPQECRHTTYTHTVCVRPLYVRSTPSSPDISCPVITQSMSDTQMRTCVPGVLLVGPGGSNCRTNKPTGPTLSKRRPNRGTALGHPMGIAAHKERAALTNPFMCAVGGVWALLLRLASFMWTTAGCLWTHLVWDPTRIAAKVGCLSTQVAAADGTRCDAHACAHATTICCAPF
jgi:hypothetical protein